MTTARQARRKRTFVAWRGTRAHPKAQRILQSASFFFSGNLPPRSLSPSASASGRGSRYRTSRRWRGRGRGPKGHFHLPLRLSGRRTRDGGRPLERSARGGGPPPSLTDYAQYNRNFRGKNAKAPLHYCHPFLPSSLPSVPPYLGGTHTRHRGLNANNEIVIR